MGNVRGKKPYVLENGVVKPALQEGAQDVTNSMSPPKDKLTKGYKITKDGKDFIWSGTGFVPAR